MEKQTKKKNKYKIQKQFMVIFCQPKAELYLEVTGSNPAGVLCYFLFCFVFFPGFLRKCKNCFHNCEDHSSFDFISAVLI